MKCISLWQPWATLVAIGAKKIETRSWPANYVGPLAIHAAKRWTPELRAMAESEPFRAALAAAGCRPRDPADLPLGCVIATCRLKDCLRIVRGGLSDSPTGRITKLIVEPEASFGDYRPGRWAWILEDVERLDPPAPARGGQRLFNWNPSLSLSEGLEGA